MTAARLGEMSAGIELVPVDDGRSDLDAAVS